MPHIPHSLPSMTGIEGDFARQLGALIGPALQAPDGSMAACDLRALGYSLSLLRATLLTVFTQAFPQEATSLLPEWERILGLPSGKYLASTAARQAVIAAQVRAYRGGSAARIKEALDLLIITNPVTIAETDASGLLPGDGDHVYNWFVILNPLEYNDERVVNSMWKVIQVMKPAHTLATFIEGLPLTCDKADAGFAEGYFVA